MNHRPTAMLIGVLTLLGAFIAARSLPAGLALAQHDDHAAHADDHEEGHDHGGHHDHDEHDETVVRLSEAQRAGLNLTHPKVRSGSLSTIVELPGEVTWNGDRLVHITPRVEGIVTSVEKTLGDRVTAGDVLCVLDSREMGDAKMQYLAALRRFEVARADFERAGIVFENTKKLLAILERDPTPGEALEQAHDIPVGDNKNKLLTAYTRMKVNHRNYKRNEELFASNIASAAELLQTQGDYEVSRADYQSTREEISFDLKLRFLHAEKDFKVAKTETRNAERALHILGLSNEQTAQIAEQGDEVDLDIARATFTSPITGLIVDRHLTQGELVSTDTRLYTIADLSDVWVIGRAYERDIRFLKPAQQATVRLDAFPGEIFEGEVDYLASQLDTQTRTVETRVVLPNPQGRLRPGMFGAVSIHIEAAAAAPAGQLLVPAAALQRVEDGFVVFKFISPGRYRLVDVDVLGRSREFAQVSGALSPGDRVAVGDTFVLKSETAKHEMGGGHSH